MATYALGEKAVLLRSEDDVAVAKAELAAGTILEDGGTRIEVRQDIKPGHKVARHAVATGEPVRRYGQVIGFATRDIAVGDHVHTQNLGIGELTADRYEIGVDVRPVDFYPPVRMRTFDGFKREDGRVGSSAPRKRSRSSCRRPTMCGGARSRSRSWCWPPTAAAPTPTPA